MKIGIFDSGRGGRFVAEKLRMLLPEHEYVVVDDREHAPYGERSYEEIEMLTHQAIKPLLAECSLIVIACNTATAAALESLRARYPDHLFVGFEPMIKPAAAASITQHITLLATQATANSQRTKQLIDAFAKDTIVDRPSTINWARSIDHNEAESIEFGEVAKSIESGSDAIIIGCTHYIALMPRLHQQFPSVTIYEPTEAIAKRIKTLTALQPQQ